MSVVDLNELEHAKSLHLDLLPLCRWDAVDEDGAARGKTPRDKNWLRTTYSPSQIKRWVEQGGNLGVRLHASQLVIDIDPRHETARGRTADQIVEDLELELGVDLLSCPRVRTGSGGLHIYTSKPDDVRVRNSVEVLGGCVEFKSSGRQVVAPGSKHPNGEYYRWVSRGSVQPCPAPILDLIQKPPPQPRLLGPGEGASLKQIKQCLDQLDPTKYRDYEKWRNLLFAVHFASGGSREGLELFKDWSGRDEEYAGSGASVEFFWFYCTDDRADSITEGTLFYEVMEAGGSVPLDADAIIQDLDAVEQPEQPAAPAAEKPKPQIIYVRNRQQRIEHSRADNVVAALQTMGVRFRADTFTLKETILDPQQVLPKYFGFDAHGREVDDRIMNMLSVAVTREIRTWSGDPSKETIERAQNAMEDRYHGVQEYLSSLRWDGVSRLDSWLVKASDLVDTPYTRGVSRLLLYGAVGRVMSPGIKFDTMVILEGPQGGGKSKLIRWLGGQWTSEGLPSLNKAQEKDVVSAMIGRWLVEIAEMDAFKKADEDSLKAFISRQEDRVRLPFARKTQTFPRQCVFVGTTNNPEYLRDLTGNRRSLPLEVGRIRVFEIPRDQLWAEAYHLWRTEPQPTEISLPSHLWRAAAEVADSKRTADPWEEIIGAYLAKSASDELTTDDIVTDALHRQWRDMQASDLRKLALVLSKYGWEKARLKTGDGRWVRGYRRRQT